MPSCWNSPYESVGRRLAGDEKEHTPKRLSPIKLKVRSKVESVTYIKNQLRSHKKITEDRVFKRNLGISSVRREAFSEQTIR